MKKVITYGTFDLLHYGHINLLRAAKNLGDYLIVGVTSDNFDLSRGKLMVQQSLYERIEAVRATGLADEVIVEEYEGQKISDIKKYNIDIFAIGSDWEGKFDYLSDYCGVVYLPRTEGVSSTDLRNKSGLLKLGVVGNDYLSEKFVEECKYVSGVTIESFFGEVDGVDITEYKPYEDYLNGVNAVYIVCSPTKRYGYIKKALLCGKHVLCETPITLSEKETRELFSIAEKKKLVLFEALRTAYSLAFQRMLLLLKTGEIGEVVSIDATCTSLTAKSNWTNSYEEGGGAFVSWGPYLLLPSVKEFGLKYKNVSFCKYTENGIDIYTKASIIFDKADVTLKAGTGVKSEGCLIISGTKGYIYVPAPWWKTEYFEVRKEDTRDNKRYFYQCNGDGTRYEISEFLKAIRRKTKNNFISADESIAISHYMEMFRNNKNVFEL